MLIRGEIELRADEDFVETLDERVASGTFLDPSVRYRVIEEPAELGEGTGYRRVCIPTQRRLRPSEPRRPCNS